MIVRVKIFSQNSLIAKFLKNNYYTQLFFNPTSRLVTGFLVNKNNLRHFTWFSPNNVLSSSQPKTHLDLHSSSYHYSARCFVQISDVSGHRTRETVSFESTVRQLPLLRIETLKSRSQCAYQAGQFILARQLASKYANLLEHQLGGCRTPIWSP